MYSRLTLAATAAALFGAATADLSVVVPGGSDLWWGESSKVGPYGCRRLTVIGSLAFDVRFCVLVDNAQNNIVWTCQGSPYANFTVLYVLCAIVRRD
jgi:hypothetical protein